MGLGSFSAFADGVSLMSWSGRAVGSRTLVVGAMLVALAGVAARAERQDHKPDQKQPDAASQAQAQEVQSLVRVADAAMTGQQVPSDFPIQFQNDFLKAQGSRVWVPMTLTIDPAKVSSGALTLYLRVVPRGMTAPPPAPAVDPKKNDKDKKKDKDKDKDKA